MTIAAGGQRAERQHLVGTSTPQKQHESVALIEASKVEASPGSNTIANILAFSNGHDVRQPRSYAHSGEKDDNPRSELKRRRVRD
jgi:hypothetical protein